MNRGSKYLDGKKWSRLHDEGMSIHRIADRFGVSKSLVSLRIKEYRKNAPPELGGNSLYSIRLEMSFGSSCKPVGHLQCWNIHPCPRCLGWGEVSVDSTSEDELIVLLEAGETIRNADSGPVVVCPKCRGSRVSEIPEGDPRTCYACGKSGRDHYRELSPPVEKPRGKYALPEASLKGGKE